MLSTIQSVGQETFIYLLPFSDFHAFPFAKIQSRQQAFHHTLQITIVSQIKKRGGRGPLPLHLSSKSRHHKNASFWWCLLLFYRCHSIGRIPPFLIIQSQLYRSEQKSTWDWYGIFNFWKPHFPYR